MSAETEMSPEQTSAELLLEIQNSNNFLFHGSHNELTSLNPSKPKGDMSEKEFNKTESVFATSSAARAVVSAIMPRGKDVKIPVEWGTSQDTEGNVILQCKKQVLDLVTPGFVYVLGEKDKALKDPELASHQYKYDQPVKPLIAVPVTFEDFVSLGGKVELLE